MLLNCNFPNLAHFEDFSTCLGGGAFFRGHSDKHVSEIQAYHIHVPFSHQTVRAVAYLSLKPHGIYSTVNTSINQA